MIDTQVVDISIGLGRARDKVPLDWDEYSVTIVLN